MPLHQWHCIEKAGTCNYLKEKKRDFKICFVQKYIYRGRIRSCIDDLLVSHDPIH